MSTRSTRKASGVGKKAPVRKSRAARQEVSSGYPHQTREAPQEDEQSHHEDGTKHHYNGNLAVASRHEFDQDEEEDEHVLDTVEPLNQMADMAEKVGREVETFAENLDQFLDNLPTSNRFDAVLELVAEFRNIAKDAAYRVRKDHEQQSAQQLRKEWSAQAKSSTDVVPFGTITKSTLRDSLSHRDRERVQDWRRWQQEADLWDLFAIVLNLHHNPDQKAVQEDKEEQLHALGAVHRYTTEDDLWKHFVLQNDLAKERELVKAWLERTVDHQESDLPGISQELQSGVSQGKGMWSRGWMHTREQIKGKKRLNRLAPTSADSTQVTALDPDAPTRQDRKLEAEDAHLERSMWIMCWEMLRRGKSWQEVSEWCTSQNEGWRAISIGKGSDSTSARSMTAWRNVCYLAAQSGHSSDWEGAVYGLLGGNLKAVHKVCRNVDDTLFAHYSAALIRQFEQYLEANLPGLESRSRRTNDDALKDPQQQIVDLILKLRKEPLTSNESIQPMKIIQSYLLADDVGSMIHTLGFAIAYTDSLSGRTDNMIRRLRPFWPEDANQPEAEIALNPQTLRIAVHMGLLLRELTNEQLEGEERVAEENVIVAYIQTLRAAGQRELIPLYASRLSVGRYIFTMSRLLKDITTLREQEQMLSLLHNYNMDNILIITEQLGFLLVENLSRSLFDPRPFKILEKVDDTHLYPGERIIDGFLPESTSESDEAIVRGLSWYSIIPRYWVETFYNLSLALRKCLVAGHIACALSIVHEFPYENIAIRKSYQITGKSINPMDHEGSFPPKEQAKWELMIRQSKPYYELERLVRAMKALANWRAQEAEYSARMSHHLNVSAPPPDLKRCKEEVDEAMSAVLTGRILQETEDHEEAADFKKIRKQYIPEMVLAYNTVLHSAGSLLSRENLIESMDLSVIVADEANGLAECFTEAGRMRELVTSFAQTSKAMLVMKSRKQWKPRKDGGKDLGMWEVTVASRNQGYDRDVSL